MNDTHSAREAMARVVIPLTDEHHVVRAQTAAESLALSLGFSQTTVHRIGTAVTELAQNLLLHATRGRTITLAALRQNGKVGVEVVAEDAGPGIPDLTLAMQNGFSTRGGLGGGLPGVKRLVDEFAISSSPDVGTRIAIRKWQPCR